MTKGTAKVFETDAVIFQTELDSEALEKTSIEQEENKLLIAEEAPRENNESRFARLKKSLRKKSASIL